MSIKYQIMAWMASAGLVVPIAWIKKNGGKISAWLFVVGDLIEFGRDMNATCADGKATPEEMEELCKDWNVIIKDLGLTKLQNKPQQGDQK